MTKQQYPTCDHPRLLVKDGVCVLCKEYDGQTDIFSQLKDN